MSLEKWRSRVWPDPRRRKLANREPQTQKVIRRQNRRRASRVAQDPTAVLTRKQQSGTRTSPCWTIGARATNTRGKVKSPMRHDQYENDHSKFDDPMIVRFGAILQENAKQKLVCRLAQLFLQKVSTNRIEA